MQEYFIAAGTILTVVGFCYKMISDMRKDCNSHRTRVYERFDDHKKDVENTHVSKEVFNLTYKQFLTDILEIKADIKELLNIKRNGKA